MKFIHTADWQIGMRAAQAGEAAERVREERLAAAGRLVEIARDRTVDFLLLAGDTFEDNGVDRLLVRRVLDLVRRARCPVFVLPGNHDPLGPGSVFREAAWGEAEPQVRVLRDATPVEVVGGVLLPSPSESKTSTTDPTTRIPARTPDDRGIRVGVAHGSLRDRGFEVGEDFPIDPRAPDRLGLDYLALGHWHSTYVEPAEDGARLAYPGTHETTSFGEKNSGNALVVEIERTGIPARVEIIRTGGFTWVDRSATLASDDELGAIRREVEGIPDPERTLLRLRVEGLVSVDGFRKLEDLETLARARFLSARIEREGVRPRPEDEKAWCEAVPDGVPRRVVERLLRLAAKAEAPEGDLGRGREVACYALSRLVGFAQRVRS